MEIDEWVESELGAHPRRASYTAAGVRVGDFRIDRLELVGDAHAGVFHPGFKARTDFAFEREAPEELVVLVGRTGQTFVQALVDGRDRGWFAFATGASISVVSNEVAGELEMDTWVGGGMGVGASVGPALRSVEAGHSLSSTCTRSEWVAT